MSVNTRLFIQVFVCLVLASFLGCATLSEKQCRQGNWHDLGIRDGIKGSDGQQIQKHNEACIEYGIKPDIGEYEKGRVEGLKVYCKSENGFLLGRKGEKYNSVCPKELERVFLRRYKLGWKMYETEQRMSIIYNDITELQNELDIEKDESKRRSIRKKITKLSMERDRLQRHLTVLEMKAERMSY